ncbi:MAG: YCF48-related protein [Planctomycetota bacterium]|nr:YCF48-related protein [Planctomycetota bacterium]
MKAKAAEHQRSAIQQRHGVPFVDFVRTHYWASFNILPNVAEKCGITVDELRQLIDEEAWNLQKPPSLVRQNRPVEDLELLDAVDRAEKRVDSFIRDSEGSSAACRTRVTCRIEKDRLHLRITCCESHMQDVSFVPLEEPDPDAEILWSGNTEALKTTAAWEGGPEQFRKRVQEVGDRKRSIFTDDCVVITLCAVVAGDCPAYLAPVRSVRNPLPMLADPPERMTEPRIHLEGSYYTIAVAPTGQIVGAFYDPWDGGVFWPCWESGTKADVSHNDLGWTLDVTVPLGNLEPLAVRDSVWGVDVFRRRPARGDEEPEWSRSAESIFFRQTDNDLGEGRFLASPEEFENPGPRHAYIASELPYADRIVPRDIPSVAVRLCREGTDDLKDDLWSAAETISDFWIDQTGVEPTSRMDVRVACDREFLYVRFDCHDDDTANLRVVTREQELAKYGENNRRANYLDRREAFGLDWGDYVEILLAPGIDEADVCHSGYYNILINSRGDVQKRYYDPYGASAVCEMESWNPALRVRVQIGEDRWQVFVGIPVAVLYCMDRATDTWRCNFKRARGARNPSDPDCQGSEISAWSPGYGRCRLLERLGFLNFEGAVPQAKTAGAVTVPGDTDEGIVRRTSPTAARDGLLGVHFPTPEKGWAVGGLGTILHTDNGGNAWRAQESNTDHVLEDVLFLNEHQGFAAGGRPRSQRVAIYGNAGIILSTSDGGENWKPVFSDQGVYLCDICFPSNRVGYVVGEYGVVLKTTDGGESWRHLANTGTERWLSAVHFLDEDHGWAAGEYGAFIATSDGGRTWRRQEAPTRNAPFGIRALIRSIHFLNHSEGWVAGDRGTFMHTLDGGLTWQSVDLGFASSVTGSMHFNAIRFFDGQRGLLIGDPGAIAYWTQDAGRTWIREDGPTSTALRGACIDPRGVAWAVGELGCIACRGEQNWQLVTGETEKPRLLYGTPHGHHVNSTCWLAMADDYDVSAAFGGHSLNLWAHSAEMMRTNMNVGCLEVGMRGTRTMNDMPCGRRREPHRICHLYQNWQGIGPTERRLAAIIRSLKPEIVIAEWPILQEGYWAADVGIFARALIRAFDSAADPERFPELTQLGLEPWRAERLYGCQLPLFGEAYQIGERKDWTVGAKEKEFVEAIGMRVGDARYRGGCNWVGLLDRAHPRTPKPLGDYRYESSFHLIKEHGK